MSDFANLIRPELLAIKPFDVTRPGFEQGILLDANELPWESGQAKAPALNRYVDEMFEPSLLASLAAFYETLPEQILLTRGSCEGIDLLVRAFCRPGLDAILVCPPTFSIFSQCALMQGAKVNVAPLIALQDYALDVELLLNSVTENTKLVFLCTPNNPTGNVLSQAEIIRVVEALQGKAMVVVDEAYIEFATEKSAASLVERYSNLVVLRTFSKAFGLAGLRCGTLIAQNGLIKILTGMMMPFPFSVLTLQALQQALQPMRLQQMQQHIAAICAYREQFKQALKQLAIVKKVWDSAGNFLFIQLNDTQAVLQACHENNILVRHFVGVKGYEDYLRVTVALPEQNAVFLQTLSTIETFALSD